MRTQSYSFLLLLIIAVGYVFSSSTPSSAAADYSQLLSGVQRTVLPNGLTLLSKEVHSAPVVSVYVYYRAGAKDEKPGESGIAHVVEHMMFKGTRQLHPGDIHRIFSEWGGEYNGQTSWDYTAYHETLPSSGLEDALRLEADRMNHSLMDPAELAREKTVVLSELESRASLPSFRLGIAVRKAAFTRHPYRYPAGGTVETVRNLTPEQVQQFYKEHYTPRNAVLVVVGDFAIANLQKLAGQYFNGDAASTVPAAAPAATAAPMPTGNLAATMIPAAVTPAATALPAASIPAMPTPPATAIVEPAQDAERRIKVAADGNISYVEVAYHIPQTGTRDHVIMDVISILLSNGATSRLSESLLNRGLVSEFRAADLDTMNPFLMEVTANVARGHTAAEVDRLIEMEMERLKREPVGAPELQRAMMQLKSEYVFKCDGVTSMARLIGFYDRVADDHYAAGYLSQVAGVTAADIQIAARRYFTTENRTVGWLEPSGVPAGNQAAPPKETPKEGTIEETPGVDGMTSAPGAVSPYGRPDTAKLIASILHTRLPVFRQALPNGITLLVAPNHSTPDVTALVGIRAGTSYDPPGKAGVAHLAAHLLHWGSTNFTGLQIATLMDVAGARSRIRVGADDTVFSMQCLPDSLPIVLGVVADQIRNPVYRPEFLASQKALISSLARGAGEDPVMVARSNLMAALYPTGSEFHWAEWGAPETRNHIWAKDMQLFHQQYYRPDSCTIVIAGDIDPVQAVGWVTQAFGSWTADGPKPEHPALPVATEAVKDPIVNVVPGAGEAVVMMGAGGIERQRPDFYSAELMNMILGGWGFTSRLMRDVRDREGLVYHISSSFTASTGAGPWILWFESSPENTGKAISHAVADIKKLQEKGVTPDEMQVFKNWVAGHQALGLETPQGVAQSLFYAEKYNLGLDYPWQYPTLIAAVTPEAVQDAARRLLHPERLVISIAGPAGVGVK